MVFGGLPDRRYHIHVPQDAGILHMYKIVYTCTYADIAQLQSLPGYLRFIIYMILLFLPE